MEIGNAHKNHEPESGSVNQETKRRKRKEESKIKNKGAEHVTEGDRKEERGFAFHGIARPEPTRLHLPGQRIAGTYMGGSRGVGVYSEPRGAAAEERAE